MPVPESPVGDVVLPVSGGQNYLCPQSNIQKTIHPYIEEKLSFQGLPKGSDPAQVVRCIELLEHIANCENDPERCVRGEGCRRLRQVLDHHFTCRNMKSRGENCNVCCQLLALCRNHSDRCQTGKENCAVPYCKNNKQKVNSRIYSIPKQGQTSREYQYVMKKLSEAMNLPTKQQKLRGIERLLITNRQVTHHILRCIIAKKQSSQQVSLNHQMRNLNIRKALKPLEENPLEQGPNPVMRAPTSSCLLKVLVKAFPNTTRVL